MKKKQVYICKTDWDYEVGVASGHYSFFNTLKQCQELQSCTEGCGIVRLNVELDEVVQEPDDDRNMNYKEIMKKHLEDSESEKIRKIRYYALKLGLKIVDLKVEDSLEIAKKVFGLEKEDI